MNTLLEQLSQLPEYREKYLSIPPALSGTENVQLGSHGFITDQKEWNWNAILDCLQEEIHTAGFETWYQFVNADLSHEALISYATESSVQGLTKA